MKVTSAAIATLLMTVVASPATAQRKKPDPLVAQQLAMLKDALSDSKGAQDKKAVTLLKELGQVAPKMIKGDVSKTAKGARSALFVRKHRGPGAEIYMEASRTLGSCGPTGARLLVSAIAHARFKDDLKTQRIMLQEIGRTEDIRQVPYLLKTARRSPKDPVMAAAGGALQFYRKAPIKLRRDIVDQLLVTYGEVYTKASDPHVVRGGTPQDFTKQNAEATLRAIRAPWTKTLQSLTGQTFRRFEEWQRWENKNKNWKDPR